MTDLTFDVDEMTCAGCVARVERAIQRVRGVKGASVTLTPGRAVVQVEGPVTPAEVARAITEAGYPARPVD